MRILFCVPDNRVTHSYMPTLRPQVLRALTPPRHSVTTLDGDVVRTGPAELAKYGHVTGELQRRGIFCDTAFIMGIDPDRPGVARKTWEVVRGWPPGFFSRLQPVSSLARHAAL